jgi:MFS family permease
MLPRVTTRPSPSAATVPAPGHEFAAGLPMLVLLCVALPLAMSPWFAGSAVAPQLRERWALDVAQAGWLTALVQLGFVAGTATLALLNLADLLPSRALFALAALGAALANAALLACPGYAPALATRFATGFFLAGAYPPAMKMTATWFRDARGHAIGVLVGSLALGKGLPYLVHATGTAPLVPVVCATSAAALVSGALVALFYRDGAYPFAPRRFSWALAGSIVSDRRTRLAIAGYLGHMWELYAVWAWIPAYLVASAAAGGGLAASVPWLAGIAARERSLIDVLAFLTLAAGGAGCVWGGWWATRVGYARVVKVSMAASGACCLLSMAAFGAHPLLVAGLAFAWGFFVVADSAQFSAMVTEVAPPHAVGTALMLQTSLGFLLTMGTIQLVPALGAAVGWRWAFAVLALGPAFGIAAIARLGATADGTTSRAPTVPPL